MHWMTFCCFFLYNSFTILKYIGFVKRLMTLLQLLPGGSGGEETCPYRFLWNGNMLVSSAFYLFINRNKGAQLSLI